MATETSVDDKPMPEQVTDYFDTESRAQCLNLVAHLVRNTDEVPYISGPEGAGKSSFAARLADGLEGEFRVVSAAGDEDLAQAVCGRLGIEMASGDWVTRLLDVEEGAPVLVLVDDAGQLSQQSQQAAMDMRAEGVRLILVGAPPLPPSLLEGAREIDLPPLTEQETRAYLGILGRRAGVPVSPAVAARLHKACGGWPGRLADQLATGKPPAKAAEERPGGPRRWLLGVVLIAVVAGGLLFQEQINRLFEGDKQPTQTVELALPPQPIARDSLPSVSSDRSEPEPVVQPPRLPEVEGTAEVIAPELAMTETVSEAATPVEVPPADVPDGGLPEEKEPMAVMPEPQAKATEPRQPVNEPPAVSEPADEEPKRAEPAALRDGGEAWLRSQAAKAYTLQLVGAREPAAIRRFINRHRLTGTYAVFERELSGKPWYSLVLGSYPDRDSAVAARESLPKGLRKDDIWPRTFESIQVLLDKP